MAVKKATTTTDEVVTDTPVDTPVDTNAELVIPTEFQDPDALFAEAQARQAEELAAENMSEEELDATFGFTVAEAIGILKHAISKSTHFNKSKLELLAQDIENANSL